MRDTEPNECHPTQAGLHRLQRNELLLLVFFHEQKVLTRRSGILESFFITTAPT